MAEPLITIGVPVYKSSDIVGETLASIMVQTHKTFEAIVSVDANDAQSAEVCERLIGNDPQFRLIVQPTRLGWAANINVTMQAALNTPDSAYYCYWQHDDLNAPEYFEALLAMNRPDASILYSDVIWFGDREGLEEHGPVSGFALNRVLMQIDHQFWVPFRGLVRREALAAIGPLRVNEYDSIYEDVVWVTHAAREGELVRLHRPLVRKRYSEKSTHAKQMADPEVHRRRGAWIAVTAGLVAALWPLITRTEDGWRALCFVLDRMLTCRPELRPHYAPATHDRDTVTSFARDAIYRIRDEGRVDLTAMLGVGWEHIGAQCSEMIAIICGARR
ncbi:MAG: glycosyltransferase family 2 protein [Caulobacterales bacterium]